MILFILTLIFMSLAFIGLLLTNIKENVEEIKEYITDENAADNNDWM